MTTATLYSHMLNFGVNLIVISLSCIFSSLVPNTKGHNKCASKLCAFVSLFSTMSLM